MSQATENANDKSRTADEVPCSHFYLTNFAVERVDELIDEEQVSDIADLWVRDMEDLDDGKCYPLISETPNRWEVKGAIEMPHRVREIRCEVHCANGHMYSIVDADCAVASLQEASSKGFNKIMEGNGESERVVISWEFAIEPELGTSGVAAHINACSCEACIPKMLYTPRAIGTLQLALKITPMSHPSISRCLVKLAKEHRRTFSMERDPSHIDDALSTLSRALQLTPTNHPDFPSHLEDISKILMLRFDFIEDVSNLDGAISKLRQAVKATGEENIKLGCRQNSLGQSLYLRFERTGNLSDLSDSIVAQTKALELSLRRHISLKFLAKELRRSLQSFVKRVDSLLHDAKPVPSQCNTDAACVAACGCDSVHLLSTLASVLHLRFKRVGTSADLAAAISIQRLLVRLTSGSHPDYAIFLHGLGSSLQTRFRHYGNLCDIDEAISLLQVSLSGKHHPGCHTGQLEDGRRCMTHSIASCFRDKYEVTRDRDNLDEAICVLQRMVDRDPHDSTHPCVAAWLRTLASSFSSRFEHTGDIRDISEAISIQGRLVRGSDDQHSSRIDSGDLVTLARMLDSRFVEFGDIEDIDRAISLGRKAIQPSSDHSSDLPLAGRLQSLAELLTDRVSGKVRKISGLSACQHEAGPRGDPSPDVSDGLAFKYLTEAAVLSRKSVDLTPSDDPKYPVRLDNLATCLHALFDHAENPHDIDEAIDLQVKAIELAPNKDAARKSAYMTQLGELYHCRYSHLKNDEDLAAMISTYESALPSLFQAPDAKLQAAIRFARHCTDAVQIVTAFDAATDAAAMMVGLGQTIRERYSRIQGLSEMPLEAAAAACRSSLPDKALEWLEQGRCLVWSQLNYLRTPLETLREHDPALATSIADVSKRLEEAGSRRKLIDFHMPESDKISLDDEARDHAKLARRWDELLVQARTIPGFESFLKPLSCSALIRNLPSSGNIVIVTAHTRQCDAIALIAGLGEPLHIPLPDLTISKAREYGAILNRKLRVHGFRSQEVDGRERGEGEVDDVERGAGRYRAKDRNVLYVLKGLWIEVVKPILDALAISKADDPSASTLHRIWWCPTGVLSFLPLHAAGIYSEVGSECVLDYVVSSYTPSVSSLLERVRNDLKIEEGVSGLFWTNQPNVRGQKPLTGTTKEVNSIHTIATEKGIRALKIGGSALSVDDCLKCMEDYSSVHFACHGLQSANDPLKSQLRLETGALELGQIMQKNLKHADLAFLSACETSTGEEKLDNEAVHLAAGMLAAGYRRVVGTMWEIRDSHAVDVANDFYSYLMDHRKEGSGSCFDGSRSAHALHHAVRQLRARINDAREVRGLPDELEKSLLLWIPYVHYGY